MARKQKGGGFALIRALRVSYGRTLRESRFRAGDTVPLRKSTFWAGDTK